MAEITRIALRAGRALVALLVSALSGCQATDRAQEVGAGSALLKEPEAYARLQGVEALEKSNAPHVAEHLIGALADPTWGVRQRAAQALGEKGDARAVEPLIRCVKEGNADLRRSALDALVKLGKPSVEPLIGCLKDEDPFVRERATQALGNLGDVRAVPPLNDCMKDTDADVRAAAAAALDKLRKQPGRE